MSDAQGGERTQADVTPRDLHAFGNRSRPRPPRALGDFHLASEEEPVAPGELPLPSGASTFADPARAPLDGHYHVLPAGTALPEGLAVVEDGPEVVPESPYEPTHHTIYATRVMPYTEFRDKFLSLPWRYVGKKG